MFNDPESSDVEPDFTYPKDTKPVHESAANQSIQVEQQVSEDVRLGWRYAEEDLVPVQKDPSCDQNWPLAAYWPVYVGNFKVEQWKDEPLYDQVSNYFAYYGLLTRMIFFNRDQTSEYFSKYRRNCELLDMLVYFTSREDAERAIEICHHDSYYGYNINVLPGRAAEFFDNSRSVRFVELPYHYPVEWLMENHFSEQGPVSFVGRYPDNDVIVEFGTIEAMVAGIGSQMKWKPVPLREQTMKQRFLEADVTMAIEWAMLSNPTFMEQKLTGDVLQRLFEGARPNVSTAWQGHAKFARAPLFRKNRAKQRRRTKYMMEKRRNEAKKPKTEIVSRDTPRVPSGRKSKREKEADNIVAINRMLRQYGAEPVCKSMFR